ncbi:acyl carrier protein [Mediterranea massiliensis]|uniref:acyl carrier protein n=1 Tax=Mediterranea massiliensis TaxID=1841865 RepID=UPI0025A430C1|nr:acyl carrier protein [Mediterranea massiliensis]MDM8338442.1 acyl carrier protein [Mediterranea massiliensis]
MENKDLEKFILGFSEQFDDTDASEFHANTNYKELDEWSSLVAMGIIAFIKTEYNKVVTGKEIRSCETLEELFNLISRK